MDAKRWGQMKEIYDHAIDLCGNEREGFLVEACGDDADLRRDVESLLAAYEDESVRFRGVTCGDKC